MLLNGQVRGPRDRSSKLASTRSASMVRANTQEPFDRAEVAEGQAGAAVRVRVAGVNRAVCGRRRVA